MIVFKGIGKLIIDNRQVTMATAATINPGIDKREVMESVSGDHGVKTMAQHASIKCSVRNKDFMELSDLLSKSGVTASYEEPERGRLLLINASIVSDGEEDADGMIEIEVASTRAEIQSN